MAKHSAELGQYQLAGELSGRPVYRHTRGGYYLYYQQVNHALLPSQPLLFRRAEVTGW